MSDRTRELPAGWGDDKLSEHVAMVHGNTMFIFEARHPTWEKLREIDDVFLKLLTDPPKQLPSFLLFLAHSAYRAAVVLTTGGHLTEAYAVLRSCLEDALYAAFIGIDEERFKRWAARHDDDESFKAMKNEFRIGEIITALREKAPRIAEIAQELYEPARPLINGMSARVGAQHGSPRGK